jgi:hypothetical protein
MKHLLHALRFLCLAAGSGLLAAGSASAAAGERGWPWWPEDRDNFSYTYLQGVGGFGSSTNNEEWDVLEGRASIALGRYLYLGGSYTETESRDFPGFSTRGLSAYFGAHGSVGEQVDMLLDVGYRSNSLESPIGTLDADGPQLGFGFRGVSPEKMFEAELRYSHYWLEDDAGRDHDDGIISFDLLWRATSHLGVVVRATWEKDANKDTLGTFAGGLRLWL